MGGRYTKDDNLRYMNVLLHKESLNHPRNSNLTVESKI